MRILFLDDMQIRHDAAVRWFKGHELVQCYTAQEAIKALAGPRFDLVMLDHDLAEEHYLTLSEGLSEEPTHGNQQDSYAPGTGMDVALHICNMQMENLPNVPGIVVVHSWNPSRARQMHELMRERGINSYRSQFDPCRCPVNLRLHQER